MDFNQERARNPKSVRKANRTEAKNALSHLPFSPQVIGLCMLLIWPAGDIWQNVLRTNVAEYWAWHRVSQTLKLQVLQPTEGDVRGTSVFRRSRDARTSSPEQQPRDRASCWGEGGEKARAAPGSGRGAAGAERVRLRRGEAGGGRAGGWCELFGHRSQSKAGAWSSSRAAAERSQCRAPLCSRDPAEPPRSLPAPRCPTGRLWASAASEGFAPPPAGEDRDPAPPRLWTYSRQDGERCGPFLASPQVRGGRRRPLASLLPSSPCPGGRAGRRAPGADSASLRVPSRRRRRRRRWERRVPEGAARTRGGSAHSSPRGGSLGCPRYLQGRSPPSRECGSACVRESCAPLYLSFFALGKWWFAIMKPPDGSDPALL